MKIKTPLMVLVAALVAATLAHADVNVGDSISARDVQSEA